MSRTFYDLTKEPEPVAVQALPTHDIEVYELDDVVHITIRKDSNHG